MLLTVLLVVLGLVLGLVFLKLSWWVLSHLAIWAWEALKPWVWKIVLGFWILVAVSLPFLVPPAWHFLSRFFAGLSG